MNHILHTGLSGRLGRFAQTISSVPFCAFCGSISFALFAHLRDISPRTPHSKKSLWENGKIAAMVKNMLYSIKNAKNVLKVSWGIHFTYFAYFAYFGYYKLLNNNKLQMKNIENYLLRLTSLYFDLAPLLRFTSVKWGLLRKNGGLNSCFSDK